MTPIQPVTLFSYPPPLHGGGGGGGCGGGAGGGGGGGAVIRDLSAELPPTILPPLCRTVLSLSLSLSLSLFSPNFLSQPGTSSAAAVRDSAEPRTVKTHTQLFIKYKDAQREIIFKIGGSAGFGLAILAQKHSSPLQVCFSFFSFFKLISGVDGLLLLLIDARLPEGCR